MAELGTDRSTDHGNRALLSGRTAGANGNRRTKPTGKDRPQLQFRAAQVDPLEEGREAALEILAEPVPERDDQQAAGHRAEHHGQPGQAPFLQGVTEQLLALLEHCPMHEFDCLAKRVIAQATEQTDNHREDDQESVFTEAEAALQGCQKPTEPHDKGIKCCKN